MIVEQLAGVSRRVRRLDLYIALAVFVVAWTSCRLYLPAFRAGGGRAMTYYDQFGPAVMVACGRGLVNPPRAEPALDEFLLERTDRFDCRSLDPRTDVGPLNSFQAVTRNLLIAAAVWRITGISWTALDNLAATMFSVTLTAAYLVMRIVLGRVLALVGALVWGISPMHLSNVPHLRDYSKAPFFLLTALAIALAIRARSPRTLVAVGAAFGLAQGIGLGMRTDVILNFVPFLIVLFVLTGGAPTKNVRAKCAAAVSSLVLFVVVAWPILTGYQRSEGLWHVSLLGLTTPFDQALYIRPAPYDFGYLYDDSYMSTVVHAYWYRVHDAAQVSLHDAGLYDRACREYYALLASTFPGDFLTRMAGSALHVLNLPFSIRYGIEPLGLEHSIVTGLSKLRAVVMVNLAGLGPLAMACLLVLIAMRDRLAACVAFVLVLFWTTYPYLQFHERHVFHLEILMIVVLLWAAQLAWRTVAAVRDRTNRKNEVRRALLSSAMIGALVGVATAGVLIARIVQTPRARTVLAQYAGAEAEGVDVQSRSDDRVVRFSPDLFEPAQKGHRIQQAMLVLNTSAGCGPEIPVHLRYMATGSIGVDFSRDLTLNVGTPSASLRLFLPVYAIDRADGSATRFSSVDVPKDLAPCVRLARARGTERLPLMIDASLSHDWQDRPMYERLYLAPIVPERVWLRVARWWPRVAQLG